MSSKQDRSIEKPKSRSAARLGRQLEKHLLAYAAAAAGAGLLSAAPSAEAEIIYTPSNTPMAIAQTNHGIVLTPLDLNNDGVPDFSFAMSSTLRFFSTTVIATTTHVKFLLKVVPGQAGNEAVQGQLAPTASAVPAGVKIGPQEKFAPGDLYMAIKSCGISRCTRNSGTWQKVEYAYVGLKFLIDGQVHYGWARVSFPTRDSSAMENPITSPAFMATPTKARPTSPSSPGRPAAQHNKLQVRARLPAWACSPSARPA